MLIGELASDLSSHGERLNAARATVVDPVDWYRYDILGNVIHLDRMLTGPYRDLDALARGLPVADIGAADGDLAFTLEGACGWELDIVDSAATNHNGLRGARLLQRQLGSRAHVHDIDLDQQFRLPRDEYGLVLLLGILYHLQNPFYTLAQLARQATYCLLSTRVARFAGPQRAPIDELSVAYLLSPTEMNSDPTNYWIFSAVGLERLVERAGWVVRESMNVGDTDASNTDSNEHDERMFMLIESTSRPASAPPGTRRDR
jgi:hypothetical protein